MSGRRDLLRPIRREDLRLDVDPAPVLDPVAALRADFRCHQLAAAAVRLAVQAVFYTAASRAAEARGAPDRARGLRGEARRHRAAADGLEARR